MFSYIIKALGDGNKDGWFGWYIDPTTKYWYNKYHDEEYVKSARKCKPLIPGLFKLKDTHGLPFDLIWKELDLFGARPDLFHWSLEAMHAGHGLRGVKAEIKSTLPIEQHKTVDFFVDLAYGELSYDDFTKFLNSQQQYGG